MEVYHMELNRFSVSFGTKYSKFNSKYFCTSFISMEITSTTYFLCKKLSHFKFVNFRHVLSYMLHVN